MTPTFFTDGASVHWNAGGRAFRLTETEVELILDIFQRERAVEQFNALYALHLASGGIAVASSLIAKEAA